MLMPKKTKYRKSHKAKRGGVATRGTTVSFGSYGLKATTACWVTSRQIEAARRVITRYVQRTGKLWIRVFPDHPVTAKGGEIPMGKGKGSVDHYIVPVKPGTIMFEIEGIDESKAREAMRLAAHKLPVKCQFVSRDQVN
ncbi:50S ribosomal protein L16 [Patescibacteria group bacterium]|jgi:large subunit ribosomal protein L16|nr:50S ribosomal protein L16 [Patescibacteria group bacterium]HPD07620.1 50S ribosomal protein L16 [bacterium]HRT10935.1 50S ribosomal protein L16 [Patescibacteria group bacterium]HRU89786.1 50S ribosomal protein L16 [Patescibacteria group bacterium]